MSAPPDESPASLEARGSEPTEKTNEQSVIPETDFDKEIFALLDSWKELR